MAWVQRQFKLNLTASALPCKLGIFIYFYCLGDLIVAGHTTSRQSGNIFFALFGAVALVGI
ncbi:MAG TPA: hypothetical protein PKH37_00330, partial [Alphaproteobacteria bacterium]|nr:hypothetical protein [Alphaproteobacteria bacterium]